MTPTTGSASIWMATTRTPEFQPLLADTETEVCIIGAGIAGLSAACLLAREGRRVVVLDAMDIGDGETGRTTAHFFPPDERYFEIDRRFGKKGAAAVAESYKSAIDFVERIVREENIDCGFERLDGFLFAPDASSWPTIDKEYRAARRAGVPVQLHDRVPDLPFDTGPAVRFHNQAQFHPLHYLAGLAALVARRGGRIHTRSRALDIRREAGMQVVHTANARVRAQSVIVATNAPFNDRLTMHTKQAGYRTYVIGMRVPKGSVPRLLLWDTADPYIYVRLQTGGAAPDEDILIVGGADHKVGQDERPLHRYTELESWTSSRFPSSLGVAYRWSGEVMEPSDGLAYLGRFPGDDPDLYLITGDSGNGMTHCTAGAMLICNQIQQRETSWGWIYDPSRKATRGLGEFMREQVNALAQYTHWLNAGEVDSVEEIAAGDGAIVRDGLRRIAVHRDDDGGLHVLSAACTHLGCSVAWNAAEKSWDCPCHGSRFDVDGEVLHGPASKALAAESLPDSRIVPRAVQDRSSRRPE